MVGNLSNKPRNLRRIQPVTRLRQSITALVLPCAVLLIGGCSILGIDRSLPQGSAYTTPSGITFTLPRGATATVAHPRPGEVGGDVPFTEFINIEVSPSLVVSVMSFERDAPRALDSTIVVQSADVVVRDSGGESLRAIVETKLSHSAPGRIVVIVPPEQSDARRGVEIAREAVSQLSMKGFELPPAP